MHYETATVTPDPLTVALKRLAARTPEEIARSVEAARLKVAPRRPLPEGKTLFDAIGGAWPGNETDEQVHAALERLS